jgi:membrane protease YdiL (CAAX protease family)
MDPSHSSRLSHFWFFILTTFIISGLAWVPLAFSHQDAMQFPNILLFIVGGFGPSLAGIFWTWRTRGGSGLREMFSRALKLRFPIGYYAVIVLIWPALFIGATLLAQASRAPSPDLTTLQTVLGNPLALAGIVIITLIAGPLSEEFGWRGFGLDILLNRWGPVYGSLLVGLCWGLWHLPLFFIAGTSQSHLPFPIFGLNMIMLSVIMTWLYQSTKRSLAAPILLHFMYNLSFAFLPLNPRSQLFLLVLQIPIALPLIIGWLAEHRQPA